MNVSSAKQFTTCTSLAALGVKLRELDLFGPIHKRVYIAQKTAKYQPIDKVHDAFISILAGVHGLVEINTCLRTEPSLQQTLDACTSENGAQMEQALDEIYCQ